MSGSKKIWLERYRDEDLRPSWLGPLVLMVIIIIFAIVAYGYLTRS